MKFVIVTGMSGAGKSRAIEALEDIGFYCVDNMPLTFIPKFAEICFSSQGKMSKVAIVTDIRGGESFEKLLKELNKLKEMGLNYTLVFLDATDETIIRRYKETRRKHPLEDIIEGSIYDLITSERKALNSLFERAEHIVDTTFLTPTQLKEQIVNIFTEGKKSIVVSVISFGYKYGIPSEADMVFDVRCLPNPYYDVLLKHLSGLDKQIIDFVFKCPQTVEYVNKICDMMSFLMPLFTEEGKSSVVVAIGCTGGRHRSVAIAEKVKKYFDEKEIASDIYHRDMLKTFS